MTVRQLYRFKIRLEVVTCLVIILGVMINAIGVYHKW